MAERRPCERYGCPGTIRPDASAKHDHCCLLCATLDRRFDGLRKEWDNNPARFEELDAEWDALGRVAVALNEFVSLFAEHRGGQ